MRGELIHDPEPGWIGKVDWSTQDVWKSGPPAVAARGSSPCGGDARSSSPLTKPVEAPDARRARWRSGDKIPVWAKPESTSNICSKICGMLTPAP
jgi:hypothetical protein